MIDRRRLLALGSLTALPWLAPARAQMLNPFAGITSVEVFCNSAMLIEPISNPPFSQAIYRMDALERLRQAINRRIPTGGEQPARQWLLANQAKLKRLLAPVATSVANAINRAHYYRIDRLPAIVINRKSVVYGVTDVADAITRYQAHVQGKR